MPDRNRSHPDFEAFVLAGGASSRFGSDKALAGHEGMPLIERACRTVAGLGCTPRVVAPRWQPYAAFASAFVVSERPGRGPVEGVRAALNACAAAWALVLTVDMPSVPVAALGTLLEAAAEDVGAVCFREGDRRHPFPGVYRRSLLSILDAATGPPSMQALLDRAKARVLDASRHLGDPAEVLRNVNRPEDLRRG